MMMYVMLRLCTVHLLICVILLMPVNTVSENMAEETVPELWKKIRTQLTVCQVIDELPTKYRILEENCICPVTCTNLGNCCPNTSLVFVYEDVKNLSCSIVGRNITTSGVNFLTDQSQNAALRNCDVNQLNESNSQIQQYALEISGKLLNAAFCITCAAPSAKIKFAEDAPKMGYRSSHGMYGEPGTTIMAILLNISIFFLILHLITFHQLPELRNLPGRNLAAFSYTLLLYFTCCEVSLISRGCRLMALFCHLILISCYSWMLILSYDCWTSVRLATKNLQQSSGTHTRRFLFYCFVCWLAVPMSAVVMALYFHVAPEDTISFYVKSMPSKAGGCSRMELHSFHIFSVVPALCLFVGNVGFYSHSAYIICRERQKKVHSDSVNNLRVCLRLALMVNLWWIFEFLGVLTENWIIRFLYSVFTVSQGTFIFFIFTFQKRILRQLLILYKDNRVISSVILAFVDAAEEATNIEVTKFDRGNTSSC